MWEQTPHVLQLHRVHTAQTVQVYYLPQLSSEFLGGKVVDERIEAAVHAAETERQFVSHVQRLVVEDFHHSMTHQDDVAGCEAEGEDQENNGGQTYRSLLLGRLGILGQFEYDTDVAESCDTEREKEEAEDAEDEDSPGQRGREHVFLQHIEARGDPEFRNFVGQVCGHHRPQHTQDQSPHEEATDDRDGLLLPGLSEQHGPDYAQVAVDADGHHGQDRAVHIGVEDDGQDTVGGHIEEEGLIHAGCGKLII